MKKAIGYAVVLALLLTGCGGSKAAADPALKIGGVTIEDTLSAASVLDVLNGLGGSYEYAEAISCVYDGMDKTYTYENAVVYTYPDGGVDKLMELYCSGGNRLGRQPRSGGGNLRRWLHRGGNRFVL